MRTTDFSRVFASAPLNATAGTVTARSGQHYEPNVRVTDGKEHWEAPPPVIPPHKYPQNPTFEDLRGRRMGRMVVVGFLGRINKAPKARWLLKCACGDYEARSSKAIIANTSEDHCCHNCAHLNKLKLQKLPDVDTWLAEKRAANG